MSRVRSFYFDFEKLSPLGHPIFGRSKEMHLLPLSFCAYFFLYFMFQNITFETKSKNKVTVLSFYIAKLIKVKSLNFCKKMAKKVIFTKFWDISKCLKVLVLRISGYIKHTFGILMGHSKCTGI